MQDDASRDVCTCLRAMQHGDGDGAADAAALLERIALSSRANWRSVVDTGGLQTLFATACSSVPRVAQASVAVAPRQIDLQQEVPDLRGQAGATGLQDVAEDELEDLSGDSDVIAEDDIPEPIDPVVAVVDEEIEAILQREQEKTMKAIVKSLRTDKKMMVNLREKDAAVARQFLCLVCDNMVIP